MTKVTLRLPASLLRRFRELAREMLLLPTDTHGEVAQAFLAAREAHFHEALIYAVAEAMIAHAEPGATLEEPPATIVPRLDVETVVPGAAAEFVGALARHSGLAVEQAWHRVVLEFCERSESPRITSEVLKEAA